MRIAQKVQFWFDNRNAYRSSLHSARHFLFIFHFISTVDEDNSQCSVVKKSFKVHICEQGHGYMAFPDLRSAESRKI